jgi:hypothetical protein
MKKGDLVIFRLRGHPKNGQLGLVTAVDSHGSTIVWVLWAEDGLVPDLVSNLEKVAI